MPNSRLEFLTEVDIRTSGYMDIIPPNRSRHEQDSRLDDEYEKQIFVLQPAVRPQLRKRPSKTIQNRHSRTHNYEQDAYPSVVPYVKATKLTDDFRRLSSPTEGTPGPVPALNYCPVCLEGPDEARTLPCHHSYCRVCLQYMIDREPKQSDRDRGFICIMCNFFVKVPNYSVPRSEWADQLLLEEYRFLTSVTQRKLDVPGIEPHQPQAPHEDNVHEGSSTTIDTWHIEWRISAFPKSYIVDNDLDPTKRTLHRFEKRRTDEISDDEDNNIDGNDTSEYLEQNMEDFKDNQDELRRVSEEMKHQKADNVRRFSKITAATFSEGRLITYDEEFCELTIYNDDLTVQSTVRHWDVHSLGVLDNLLFMTNPADRSVDILDLDNLQHRPSIRLTLQCFGIAALHDRLAVLLYENAESRIFHVSFLDENGIIGGKISLKGGYLELESPRHLAVCPLTRLLFVSDTKRGLVKCYRMDGRLSWEKIVVDAGALAVYNGDVIVARGFTNSLDVLSGGGVFNGRLESKEYSILLPSVIAVNNNESNIAVVDAQQLIHLFELMKNPKPLQQNVVVNSKTACSCSIL